MNYSILNRLEEEFPGNTFGKNKDNELFVNGKKVATQFSEMPEDLADNKHLYLQAEDELFHSLKKMLVENKLIKESWSYDSKRKGTK